MRTFRADDWSCPSGRSEQVRHFAAPRHDQGCAPHGTGLFGNGGTPGTRGEAGSEDQAFEAANEALGRFAQLLEADRSAVELSIAAPWSNGPVEGHINRLKVIKRQPYGRAGFELLKARVLPPQTAASVTGGELHTE